MMTSTSGGRPSIPHPPTPPATGNHPLDVLVHDPSGVPPLCDEREFADLLNGMVSDAAPRLFAVVQEYGRRVDGCIAAWGMAFPDHAEVVAVDGAPRLSLPSAQSAVRAFHDGTHIRARLMWVTASDQ